MKCTCHQALLKSHANIFSLPSMRILKLISNATPKYYVARQDNTFRMLFEALVRMHYKVPACRLSSSDRGSFE